MREQPPELFEELGRGQRPEYLWIGCADSRIPATMITGQTPGSIFVHRNIANVVVHSDSNLLSVVWFALNALQVRHVLVCGHYGCGGILAAMSGKRYGFIDNWLNHLRDVYHAHQTELDAIKSEEARERRFAELNVIAQVHNLARIPFFQESWAARSAPSIHGVIYDVNDGQLRKLDVLIRGPEDIDPAFRVTS